ncbi:DNA adenine methylase [Rhizobium laguerreae]|uniref:DNA adenine methylase n=1 Tax=Rhizobium laguerreae TaxID=1076926 RepID=UPI001C92B307|nr:DNA adenine methylase [Rhizobium laguerreae]MBY3329781.1 DNA adenine methylase [Rhizobium laguerreae]
MNQSSGRLRHFTPLRYPGGKGRLAPYVKEILEANDLLDGEYVEPFAGGAAIAMELLFHEYVTKVHINDLSKPVYAFWNSVLRQTDALCALIRDTPLTMETWQKQKEVFRSEDVADELGLGFSFFFLNRTNRSGILNGGVIGGKAQDGPWKMDARFNVPELIARIEAIAALKDRISLTNLDAVKFLSAGRESWRERTLIYCDPPYYVKGRELYYHFYLQDDHLQIAALMKSMSRQKWIVSYDNVEPIVQMYPSFRHLTYDIGYSARAAKQGSEVMFFSENLTMPQVVGAIEETARTSRLA